MQIQITGRHLDVTQALKQHVEDKLSKLRNHFDQIISTRVILSVEKGKQVAEAVINVPGSEFVAKSDSQDMYAAIDMLQDKLDAQVRKHKQKLKEHREERPEAEVLTMDDEIVDIDEEH
ncbi:ribosome hibernation-promoting factor, HPF/YfiA family [Caedibacter taeniospiralis]|jgi:putative sigma-54 modulation protein|uniref:ribosome hibernation-promoting factor, HPF/YfiA family n=1 Tax=Caedibacter taeniospiralis TaxID=28907 RepID=UPI000C27E0D3